MTTTRLEEFLVLARMLNFSRAADALYISQSVLSRHVREMEEEIGVTLFERNTHGVSLTDDGKYLLRWTQPLLDKADHIISAIASEQQDTSGEISIVCDEQSLDSECLDFIHQFREKYPDIQINISINSQGVDRDTVFSSDIVMTIVDFTGVSAKEMEGRQLFSYRSLLAIPPFSRFGDKTEISLEELRRETLIVPHAGNFFEAYARNAMIANRKCHGSLQRLSIDTPQNGLLMVEMNKGVMLIPQNLKNRAYSKTRTIPVTDRECQFPVFIYHREKGANERAKLFYDSIVNYFRH